MKKFGTNETVNVTLDIPLEAALCLQQLMHTADSRLQNLGVIGIHIDCPAESTMTRSSAIGSAPDGNVTEMEITRRNIARYLSAGIAAVKCNGASSCTEDNCLGVQADRCNTTQGWSCNPVPVSYNPIISSPATAVQMPVTTSPHLPHYTKDYTRTAQSSAVSASPLIVNLLQTDLGPSGSNRRQCTTASARPTKRGRRRLASNRTAAPQQDFSASRGSTGNGAVDPALRRGPYDHIVPNAENVYASPDADVSWRKGADNLAERTVNTVNNIDHTAISRKQNSVSKWNDTGGGGYNFTPSDSGIMGMSGHQTNSQTLCFRSPTILNSDLRFGLVSIPENGMSPRYRNTAADCHRFVKMEEDEIVAGRHSVSSTSSPFVPSSASDRSNDFRLTSPSQGCRLTDVMSPDAVSQMQARYHRTPPSLRSPKNVTSPAAWSPSPASPMYGTRQTNYPDERVQLPGRSTSNCRQAMFLPYSIHADHLQSPTDLHELMDRPSEEYIYLPNSNGLILTDRLGSHMNSPNACFSSHQLNGYTQRSHVYPPHAKQHWPSYFHANREAGQFGDVMDYRHLRSNADWPFVSRYCEPRSKTVAAYQQGDNTVMDSCTVHQLRDLEYVEMMPDGGIMYSDRIYAGSSERNQELDFSSQRMDSNMVQKYSVGRNQSTVDSFQQQQQTQQSESTRMCNSLSTPSGDLPATDTPTT